MAKYTVTAIDDILNEHNDYVQTITVLNFTITKMDERRIVELELDVTRGTNGEPIENKKDESSTEEN